MRITRYKGGDRVRRLEDKRQDFTSVYRRTDDRRHRDEHRVAEGYRDYITDLLGCCLCIPPTDDRKQVQFEGFADEQDCLKVTCHAIS